MSTLHCLFPRLPDEVVSLARYPCSAGPASKGDQPGGSIPGTVVKDWYSSFHLITLLIGSSSNGRAIFNYGALQPLIETRSGAQPALAASDSPV